MNTSRYESGVDEFLRLTFGFLSMAIRSAIQSSVPGVFVDLISNRLLTSDAPKSLASFIIHIRQSEVKTFHRHHSLSDVDESVHDKFHP